MIKKVVACVGVAGFLAAFYAVFHRVSNLLVEHVTGPILKTIIFWGWDLDD